MNAVLLNYLLTEDCAIPYAHLELKHFQNNTFVFQIKKSLKVNLRLVYLERIIYAISKIAKRKMKEFW
jgi:hypothetical protein